MSNQLIAIRFVWILTGCFLLAHAHPSLAQQEPTRDSAIDSPSSDRTWSLRGIRLNPISRPRTGRFFSVGVNVANLSAHPQRACVVASIESFPSLQSIRTVDCEGTHVTTIELRLRVPENAKPGSQITVQIALQASEADARILQSADGKPLIDSLTLSVDDSQACTLLCMDDEPPNLPEWAWPSVNYQMSYELALAASRSAGFSRRMLHAHDFKLPTQLADWDPIDSVVISRPGILKDSVAMQSLKEWIARGGYAWIMMDRIDRTDSLSCLLPEGKTCEALEDVDLSEIKFESKALTQLSSETRVFDNPVHLRRVVTSGGRVDVSANGWPALLWFDVGKGRVLITTLESEGWLLDQISWNPENAGSYGFKLTPWGRPISDRFFDILDNRSPLDNEKHPYPDKLIGNPVLDRSLVLSTLIVFLLLLILVSTVCYLKGVTSWIGWLIPSLAFGGAGFLIACSSRVRMDISEAMAHLQVIEILEGGTTVQGTEWTTVYTSDKKSRTLRSKADSDIRWPSSEDLQDLRRIDWLDTNHWVIRSDDWPTGVWKFHRRFTLPVAEYDVLARLNSKGLTLEIPSSIEKPLEDAVLLVTPGDPIVLGTIDSSKIFSVPDGHWTIDDSWMNDTIINDEQTRRDEVYRSLPGRKLDRAYPSYPALVGWTKLWNSGLEWDEAADKRGAALVVLPVRLLPTATGETVLVPHSVIRLTKPKDISTASTAFSDDNGLWLDETVLRAQVPLRFVLPQQVLPLQANEVWIDIRVRAPMRTVKLTHRTSGIELSNWTGPSGSFRVAITDSTILADILDGSFELQLEVSDPVPDTVSPLPTWQIDYLRLSTEGTVLERP